MSLVSNHSVISFILFLGSIHKRHLRIIRDLASKISHLKEFWNNDLIYGPRLQCKSSKTFACLYFFGGHKKNQNSSFIFYCIFYSRPSFICKQNGINMRNVQKQMQRELCVWIFWVAEFKIIITFLCEIYCEGLNMQVL